MIRGKPLRRSKVRMRSGRSTGKPTRSEELRFIAMKYDGCICCRMRGRPFVEPDIHHLLSGGIRRGHRFTIALCQWHHEAKPFEGMTHAECRAQFGPSLKEGSKLFHAEFGSDDFLLGRQDARFADGAFA